MSEMNSDYEVRLATLAAMGGDATQRFDSVYEVDKEILRLTQEGTGALKPKVVDELPETGEAGKIYFVRDETATGDNYKEYIWINDDWECVGNADVDLTDYYTKTEIDSSLADYAKITDVNKLSSFTTKLITIGTKNPTTSISEADYNELKEAINDGRPIIVYWKRSYGVFSQSGKNWCLDPYINPNPEYIKLVFFEEGSASEITNFPPLTGSIVLYKTGSVLNNVSLIASESWVDGKGYLTSVPAEYITETELAGYNYTTMSAVEAKGYAKVVTLTQAEYDALATKDANTIYIINEATVDNSGDDEDGMIQSPFDEGSGDHIIVVDPENQL